MSEESKTSLVETYVPLISLRFVQRYASEDRQWPKDIPHPSGKRPIMADLVLQMQYINPTTRHLRWQDVPIIPGVENLPIDDNTSSK